MRRDVFGAKVTVWTGVVIAFFASTLPAQLSYLIGIRAFPDDEANYLGLIFGFCLIVGGVVAYFYERDKSRS